MSLRIPDLAAKLRRGDFLLNPLDVEIAGEKASSLGHHGRQVERALAALRAFQEDALGRVESDGAIDRETLDALERAYGA